MTLTKEVFLGFWILGFFWGLGFRADTLIENLMDPAHVPFAHHGIMVSQLPPPPLPPVAPSLPPTPRVCL